MIAPDDTTFAWVEGRDARAGRTSTPPSRAGASCAPTTARRFDTEIDVDAAALVAAWSPGARPRAWSCGVTDAVPEPQHARATSARCTTWASRPGTPIAGDRARPRVHRLVHELAHRRPARRRRGRQGPQGRRRRRRDGRARAPQQVKAQAEAEGLDEVFTRRRLRLARRRLLDVPGHEPRHRCARRALRVDLEPQLRGPPGPRRAHAPRLPADGRRGGHRGPLRRHPRAGS